MKKLMTAIAAITLAGYVGAQSIQSQNVVGYITKTINSRLTMIGVPFFAVGGDEMFIKDVIPKEQAGLTYGSNYTNSDNIQIHTGSGYITYYLSQGRILKGGTEVDPATVGWVEVGQNLVTTEKIPAGGTFWYISQKADVGTNPFDIIVAGQVANDTTITRTIKPGLNMISNAYAAELDFANPVTGLNNGVHGSNDTNSDNIQVHTGSGYTTYYLSQGRIPKGGTEVDPATVGWVEVGQNLVTTDTIPAGTAAWYISRSTEEFDWVAPRPYEL